MPLLDGSERVNREYRRKLVDSEIEADGHGLRARWRGVGALAPAVGGQGRFKFNRRLPAGRSRRARQRPSRGLDFPGARP